MMNPNVLTDQPLPKFVSAATLAELANTRPGLTILDVRSPAEYESSHIPGSVNLPLDHMPTQAAALSQAVNGPLVLVCRSGQRARQAEQTLSGAGANQLCCLDGGLAAWEAAGLPIKRGRQRWSLERQVRGIAGGLALVSALAGLLVAPPLSLLAVGVGGGLLISALTDSCTMGLLLSKLPYNQGARCDASAVVQALAARQPDAAQMSHAA